MKRIIPLLGLAAVGAGAYWYVQSNTSVSQTPSSTSDGVGDTESSEDFLWLEDVMGEEALKWVRERNTKTLEELTRDPRFDELKEESLKILTSKDKLVYGQIRGDFVYNFWQDADHVKGLWRRTSWESYVANEDKWDVLLDLDALAKKEGKSWVYKGSTCLKPDYDVCMLRLSDGGKDAAYVREFNVASKSFVENGFALPESKSNVDWLDADTLLVSSTFGDNAVTDSGYPRIVRMWKRGQELSATPVVFEGEKTDVSASSTVVHSKDQKHILLSRAPTFYSGVHYLLDGDKKIKLPIPEDGELTGFIADHVLVSLRSDQLGHKKGDLLAMNLEALKAGKAEPQLLFSPSESQALSSVQTSDNYVFVSYLENVQSRVLKLTPVLKGDKVTWNQDVLELPEQGTIGLVSIADDAPRMVISYEDYLTPRSLRSLNPETLESQVIQTVPARFSSDDLESKQMLASSKDGTKVPYFVIHKKGIELDGTNPTLLYGYGGFEISMKPRYSSLTGKLWLEQGGVYVVANIRGGGEFGPRWHQAALKGNRHKAFEDFIGVAEDLIAKKITSPKHLGISGGSNGGLLVGAVFTQRPDLFNGVVCMVPLLDMMRFHKLLAGASWMGEYGNPEDPQMSDYIRSYSPFHVVDKASEYPEVFFITSTKDDRVHPGHARKMAAKMESLGHKVYYYENIEGGHSASANLVQRAEQYAMQYTYLFKKLAN
ncbi:prolyl oligopeptidase family serine peptidase [Pseudobacteriovorax antillogorgiicola]|uniref:Prolyl oligopeptidase n=1 Tax=Pseudobacteriovorax antillogorgiicola TaxID=1513793 RepID=A0A1Y6CQC7_9BACT|nr:prolyl oligopeptidase family serine peptidase [Pseudobacteriovorax antillogorgiicola]TCS43502.1 prolyl oligopeptidase [Pseudobacteriovorax antillogorgiicola]SMF81135.1 prolyl oligopeptidase [Pseudobacteriovorax antillogorgiicola]